MLISDVIRLDRRVYAVGVVDNHWVTTGIPPTVDRGRFLFQPRGYGAKMFILNYI
jgi:hypothetical protein